MKLFVDSEYLSPYAMSVFVALREKNVLFELEPIDLARGQHRSATYAMHSNTLRVPTISDGAFNLSESSAICKYLDEVHQGTALFPTSPQLKAKAREVQAWLRSDLMPIRAERSTEVSSCCGIHHRFQVKRKSQLPSSFLPLKQCFKTGSKTSLAHGASPTQPSHSCSIGWSKPGTACQIAWPHTPVRNGNALVFRNG